MDEPRIDRTEFSIVPLTESDNDLSYWLQKSPSERLRAVEQIRQTLYGYTDDTARLQRILEIAKRE